MKTEHIMLCEDPNSTWQTKAPDLRQQDTPGPSVETRKGKQTEDFDPYDSGGLFRAAYKLTYGTDYDEDVALLADRG